MNEKTQTTEPAKSLGQVARDAYFYKARTNHDCDYWDAAAQAVLHEFLSAGPVSAGDFKKALDVTHLITKDWDALERLNQALRARHSNPVQAEGCHATDISVCTSSPANPLPEHRPMPNESTSASAVKSSGATATSAIGGTAQNTKSPTESGCSNEQAEGGWEEFSPGSTIIQEGDFGTRGGAAGDWVPLEKPVWGKKNRAPLRRLKVQSAVAVPTAAQGQSVECGRLEQIAASLLGAYEGSKGVGFMRMARALEQVGIVAELTASQARGAELEKEFMALINNKPTAEGEYIHAIHCNASRRKPIGCEMCSCPLAHIHSDDLEAMKVRADALNEENCILQSQVDNADATWRQQKICTDQVRANLEAMKQRAEKAEEDRAINEKHWGEQLSTLRGELKDEAAKAMTYDAELSTLRQQADKDAKEIAALRQERDRSDQDWANAKKECESLRFQLTEANRGGVLTWQQVDSAIGQYLVRIKPDMQDWIVKRLNAHLSQSPWRTIIAGDPASLLQIGDADRNGNVEWLYCKGDVESWPWDLRRDCDTHWRHTNLPPLPTPKASAEDEGFKKWWDSKHDLPSGHREDHRDTWQAGRASQAVEGKAL